MKKKIRVKTTDEKPYIFVSYAHADEDEVCPIIEELDRRGYRVWYDEGITAGKKWADVISRHVMECQIMLLFISDHYAASSNCEDEWSLAQKYKKNFVCVVLRPTELSPGMELQTQKRQMIFKYDEHERLVVLNLSGCPVEDPGVTFTCLRLEKLQLSGSKMTSLLPS